MLLHALLRQFNPSIKLTGIPDVPVTGIHEDSRAIQGGDLFIARGGTKMDGRQFAADAAARGAIAVITATRIDSLNAPQIIVHDPGIAASKLAHLLLQSPCEKLKVLGVTGTNGKTTTTYLIRHILDSVQRRCGMIGTVEIDDGRSRREATMTTPSAIELAHLFAAMRDKSCEACAIEVSSHALHQGRAAGVTFAGAAFTNLTGDHLDYHGTMDDYAAAKAILFESLAPSAIAIVNANDAWSARMIRDCKARVLSWGIGAKGDYRAQDISVTAEGSSFILVTPDGQTEVRMSLIGKHNIANALTAAALVGEVFHLTAHQIASALANASGAPGRLQSVRCGQRFAILVDYAHTDDALENVLTALRPLARGKLRVLFGCGGDRDRTKRPRMAKVAEKYADTLYLTSDNPRTEDPRAILDEIVSGLSADVIISGAMLPKSPAKGTGLARQVLVEPDRRTAIRRIIRESEPGDVVLLAGKGHENYQIVGSEKRHFDDVEEAMNAIQGEPKAA